MERRDIRPRAAFCRRVGTTFHAPASSYVRGLSLVPTPRGSIMEDDIRFAFRQLRKNPGFAAIAVSRSRSASAPLRRCSA